MKRSLTPGQIESALTECYEQAVTNSSGQVAQYIPELSTVPPDQFGIAICTIDGRIFTHGDIDSAFTIQSSIKPIIFWKALSVFGKEKILSYVGVEPSNEPFDSFIKLESNTHRPHNPMINAGAIALCGLLSQLDEPDIIVRLIRMASANSSIEVNMPVFLSERDTADKNRAIGYLLKHFHVLEGDLDETLGLYLQSCALSLTVRDLAVIGATLANNGVNPLSGELLESGLYIKEVLSVMMTCGIYQASGRLAHDVGVPAKSGVSGNIFMVAPGELSVAVFSPRLNETGNSVRGLLALRSLSDSLGLHMFSAVPGQSKICLSLNSRGKAHNTKKIHASLTRAFEKSRGNNQGKLADYTSELKKVSPDAFAASICLCSGEQFSIGESNLPFSIQAAANPFSYALALRDNGLRAVHNKVGVDPSGNRFDEIVFDSSSHLPFNPLTNAGAITMCSMVKGDSASQRLKQLLSWYASLDGTGVEFNIDSSLCRSESIAGNRNRAIAYLLKNFGVIKKVEDALELYFQQCSTLVKTEELARMAAVLANRGISPFTGYKLLEPKHVKSVLTVMYTCGMHDTSGEFAFHVGLPAKSGISGGIFAVAPGLFGVAVYSPKVHAHGSSVRGVEFLRYLVEEL